MLLFLLSDWTVPTLWRVWAMPLAAFAGVGLDRLFGETRHAHPLVGFGWLAQWVANTFNPLPPAHSDNTAKLLGLLAWGGLVLGLTATCVGLLNVLNTPLAWLAHALLLYFALGARSLLEHGQAIAIPLAADDLPAARSQLSRIVSRDTTHLNATEVATGAVESLLENGNDAIFGTLFWFALLGGPGALLFRLANTLDAMWGYRTPRWLHFGWAAARLDDLLNWAPARLTALTYALLGNTERALRCWKTQAPHWDSPNAGPVMAAGAGALGLQLGGTAIYHGQPEHRPTLGTGCPANAADIGRALRLLRHSLWLWQLMLAGWALLITLNLIVFSRSL